MLPTVERPRIVVIDTDYHQGPGDQPTLVESRFSRLLTTDEQPYIRKTMIGEEWKPVDSGWITHPSMLVIQNHNEMLVVDKQPTAEERDEFSSKVLEVATEIATAVGPGLSTYFLILPGESMRVHPYSISNLRIRCKKGRAKVTITVFPN